MFQTFIILFREGLEISIIISIIIAATQGITSRTRYILLGMAGGVIGSAIVAACADQIAQAMEGMGQEIFNAAILLLAVVMIGWTVIWMQQHGRELAQRIKHIGSAVRSGELPLAALATVVCVTMWREGSEIVLFTYGIAQSAQATAAEMLLGGIAGFVTAAAIGAALFFGLLTVSHRKLFSISSALLIMLACGMSAQAAGFLGAAGVLPEIVPQAWDSSRLLSDSQLIGQILHAMTGYTARPSGLQLLFYAATLFSIIGILALVKVQHRKIAAIPT